MLGWFKALSLGKKLLVGTGAFVTLSAAGGAASPPQASQVAPASGTQQAQQQEVLSEQQEVKPLIETQEETKTETVPYKSLTVSSDSLPKGQKRTTTAGVNGSKTLTYEVTYTDGIETSRQLKSEDVTLAPVDEVVTVGTYVAPTPAPAASSNCDPNYTGCVPIASDVDCAGGNGNGPAYVRGPINVIGRDIYGLDRDGNRIACE